MASGFLMAVMGASALAAEETREPDAPQRVRVHGQALRAAVALGIDRSATFRRLHATIAASDGMVYVVEGMCRHSVNACLVLSMTIAGPYRVLSILVDSRKAAGCELVGLIGHELQHAAEVLADPAVRSDRALYWLFDRIGRTGSERFETAEATAVGVAVQREACRAD